MKFKQALFAGFKNAFNGILAAFRRGRNIRIQFTIGTLVLVAGLLFRLNAIQLGLLLLLCGVVISLEILNTALEQLCDVVQPNWHAQIGNIKDMSAGAVLWMSIFSVIIGVLVFAPTILSLIRSQLK